MEKQEIMEKVQELMKDEQFKSSLDKAKDLDEFAALFQNEGIQVSGAELEAAAETYSESDELSEESLENVSGGGLLAAAIVVFVCGSLLEGYIDGVKKKAKTCKII